MSRLARRWRHDRAAQPGVTEDLVARVDEALVRVERCRAELDILVRLEAPLPVRQTAYHHLELAFDAADGLFREATRVARARSFSEWSQWRRRLSRLDRSRQENLFAGSDALSVLAQGEVRAVDTGMSGPSIGEMQHGESRPGGTTTYGLDMGVVLGGRAEPAEPVSTDRPEHAPSDPHASVVAVSRRPATGPAAA